MPRDVDHIEIRAGLNAEGDRVRDLVVQGGYNVAGLDFDWSDIEPYWLVAVVNGKIMGCLQLCPGKPVGRMELLSVEQGLGPRGRAVLVKGLVYDGMAALKFSGSQAVACLINFEEKGFKRILKKRGAVVLTSGNLLIRRI